MRQVLRWMALGCAWACIAAGPVRTLFPGKEPQLASPADAKERVYLALAKDHHVFLSVSDDGGKTFSEPALVGEAEAGSVGMRRGPRVAALPKDGVVVTAINPAGDLLAYRSEDGGKSWAKPVRINDQAKSAQEGLHHMATSAKGECYAVWLDFRGQGKQVMGSFSADEGKTWSVNRLIYASPEGHVCECCQPSVAFLESGKVAVMFRNNLAGARDMYLAEFIPDGVIGDVKKLGNDTWPLNGCPMDGGAVAGMADGSIVAIWRSRESVYLSTKTGQTRLGNGSQGWVTTSGTAVWKDATPGVLMYQLPDGKRGRIDAGHGATDPVVLGHIATFEAGGKVTIVQLDFPTGQRQDTGLVQKQP